MTGSTYKFFTSSRLSYLKLTCFIISKIANDIRFFLELKGSRVQLDMISSIPLLDDQPVMSYFGS